MLGLSDLHSLAGEVQKVQKVTLQIEGMTCGTCVKDVKASLTNVPGVSAVEFTIGKKWLGLPDYSNARASVTTRKECRFRCLFPHPSRHSPQTATEKEEGILPPPARARENVRHSISDNKCCRAASTCSVPTSA
jgi:copper chaperone CopZ